jgi:hypothetical protein
MSKYRPLSERLAQESADEWRPSFAEIEEVLGFPLPKAAQQSAWWTGGGKPHHRAWLDSGWEVGELDKAAGAVHFRRAAGGAPLGLSAGSMEATPPEPVIVEPEPAASEGGAKPVRKLGLAALVGGGLAAAAGLALVGTRILRRR